LGEALEIRERLAGEESVITADGIWLGKNWLRVTREKDGKAGILAREHEMRRLKSEMREMQARFDSARRLLADGRIRLTQLEERRETLQQDASSLLNEYSEVKAALESAKTR
jgi:chromosome segregation protein